jgi:hypothetical protein
MLMQISAGIFCVNLRKNQRLSAGKIKQQPKMSSSVPCSAEKCLVILPGFDAGAFCALLRNTLLP